MFEQLGDEDDCLYTHVSLFSGCGGFDFGLRAAGFRTLFANDINEAAAQTYRRNLGDIHVEDIRTVKLPDIHGPDVLTAGFPCQPFSNAGLRKGTKDAAKKYMLEILLYSGKLHYTGRIGRIGPLELCFVRVLSLEYDH